jgi:cyclopropane fatty-acyl-phospholipid synthase-like methyltransferase
MSMASRDPAFFQRLYESDPDPWKFETSVYEAEKYDATMAALGGRRFESGFEVGCSIGVLTARLAERCDRLLAVDVAETALARARERCARLGHVRFENRRLPADWPEAEQNFDLIVLSEVLYFLAPADIAVLAALVSRNLAPGGVVLLVNYTGVIDEPCGGEEAAERFIAASGLEGVRQIVREKYRIDLLEASVVR